MKNFQITNYEVNLNGRVPGPTSPIRMVMLSDLHGQSYGKNNSRLLRTIDAIMPDMIVIAGDMLTAAKKVEVTPILEFMQRLAWKYPVYYANGNHESSLRMYTKKYQGVYQYYAHSLRKAGVILLEDDRLKLKIKGMPAVIYGYELHRRFYTRHSRAQLSVGEMQNTIGRPDPDAYNILIAHNPTHFLTYADWGADLTLSGHLHGGFIRLPKFGGIVSPQFELFPKYDRGLYEKEGHWLVVSSGLGMHSIKMRINNPPELVTVTIKD